MAEIRPEYPQFVDAAEQAEEARHAHVKHNLVPALDIAAINQTFAARGRSDLCMAEAAPQIPGTNPTEIIDQYGTFNNFAISFKMFRGWEKPAHIIGGVALAENTVPITKSDLFKHLTLPRIETSDQHYDLAASGEFPALSSMGSHANRASYLRMLQLFTDFTIDLTLDISAGPARTRIAERSQDLLKAYNIMAQLVDVTDLYAVRTDGTVDDEYLCH